MKFLTNLKTTLTNIFRPNTTVDTAEITIFGIQAQITHKTSLPIPHEVSLYIPRLEITNKVTEGNKTTENSLVLDSLTIVSAPRREQAIPPAKFTAPPVTQIQTHRKRRPG